MHHLLVKGFTLVTLINLLLRGSIHLHPTTQNVIWTVLVGVLVGFGGWDGGFWWVGWWNLVGGMVGGLVGFEETFLKFCYCKMIKHNISLHEPTAYVLLSKISLIIPNGFMFIAVHCNTLWNIFNLILNKTGIPVVSDVNINP